MGTIEIKRRTREEVPEGRLSAYIVLDSGVCIEEGRVVAYKGYDWTVRSIFERTVQQGQPDQRQMVSIHLSRPRGDGNNHSLWVDIPKLTVIPAVSAPPPPAQAEG